MAPKPVTALGQNISFFVVHDNDGAPSAPAPLASRSLAYSSVNASGSCTKRMRCAALERDK